MEDPESPSVRLECHNKGYRLFGWMSAYGACEYPRQGARSADSQLANVNSVRRGADVIDNCVDQVCANGVAFRTQRDLTP